MAIVNFKKLFARACNVSIGSVKSGRGVFGPMHVKT